jgi:hypothetical protein
VTRNVLVSKIYEIVSRVDIVITVKTTLDTILTRLDLSMILIVVYTDSFLLYEYLVKLDITKEKCLMIDIIALR